MRRDLHSPDRGTVLRQRVQIGGAVLGVIAIWTLALWPSSPQKAQSQSGPPPTSTATPWTTGPFIGTTSSSPGAATPGAVETSAPSPTADPSEPVRSQPSPIVPRATAPPAPSTSTATPVPSWTPPGQAKKPTRPPKALDLLIDIAL